MRGGGYNAENTQVSDGRRAAPWKCRDCDNAVRSPRAHLCSDCNARSFERKQKTIRERNKNERIAIEASPTDNLSRTLTGLQGFWLSTVGEIPAPREAITRSAAQ